MSPRPPSTVSAPSKLASPRSSPSASKASPSPRSSLSQGNWLDSGPSAASASNAAAEAAPRALHPSSPHYAYDLPPRSPLDVSARSEALRARISTLSHYASPAASSPRAAPGYAAQPMAFSFAPQPPMRLASPAHAPVSPAYARFSPSPHSHPQSQPSPRGGHAYPPFQYPPPSPYTAAAHPPPAGAGAAPYFQSYPQHAARSEENKFNDF